MFFYDEWWCMMFTNAWKCVLMVYKNDKWKKKAKNDRRVMFAYVCSYLGTKVPVKRIDTTWSCMGCTRDIAQAPKVSWQIPWHIAFLQHVVHMHETLTGAFIAPRGPATSTVPCEVCMHIRTGHVSGHPKAPRQMPLWYVAPNSKLSESCGPTRCMPAKRAL